MNMSTTTTSKFFVVVLIATVLLLFISSLSAAAVAVATSSSESKTTTSATTRSTTTTTDDESVGLMDDAHVVVVESSPPPPKLCTQEYEWFNHPVLCHTLQRLHTEEDVVVQELYNFAKESGWIVDLRSSSTTTASNVTTPTTHNIATSLRRRHLSQHHQPSSSTSSSQQQQQLPVVLAHGMGDSCFNDGMQHITSLISQWLGDSVYTVCIPTGDTQQEDTKNGYFLNMFASVNVFADAIRRDPALQNGFHAIGFSQGNNVIRGYIATYNTPTVHTFISVNGVNAGIGAVPYCRPKQLQQRQQLQRQQSAALVQLPQLPTMCDLLMEQASHAAYTEFAQEHSFQANYWRDPRPGQPTTLYRTMSQLAVWNNEVPDDGSRLINETLRTTWNLTSRYVWVLAQDDQMVWPAAGEQWSAPDPNDPFHTILPMPQTPWYQQDLFGLRTADMAGKNYFESFVGDHLQFTADDLHRWVTTYFTV